jgi:PAT family acetyl-CoA transporter-like MFS transporter 1
MFDHRTTLDMKTRTVPAFTVLFLVLLYLSQGVIIGFTTAIPLYLDSRGAKWQEQGTFNFAFYPFSLKLSWAPVLDAIYISRFGRRKTWLVPIQLAIGTTLIVLSFSLTQLIADLRIQLLTCIFFFVYFLLATHDTCVDGWSLTLLAKYNLQWASTCQTIGQTTGRFVGFTLLMILESSDFTNRYVRMPLSLVEQPYGLFTMDQFVRFCGVAFLIMAACISLSRKSKGEDKYMSLSQTYLSLIKLLKKNCIQRLAILLLTSPIGYAATYTMTNLVLKRYNYQTCTDTFILFLILGTVFLRKRSVY